MWYNYEVRYVVLHILFSEKSKQKDEKPTKRKKDPNAPKRAQSAYFMFLGEKRPEISKDHKGVAEVAKKAAELWKNLNAEEKEVSIFG